jgi:hypothetical protein
LYASQDVSSFASDLAEYTPTQRIGRSRVPRFDCHRRTRLSIPAAAAARQFGVSRSWASREANAPGTRCLIAELLEPHREQLNELFRLTLDLIKDAFQARKIFVVRGVLLDGRPDHDARLEAGKLLLRLVSSRRG